MAGKKTPTPTSLEEDISKILAGLVREIGGGVKKVHTDVDGLKKDVDGLHTKVENHENRLGAVEAAFESPPLNADRILAEMVGVYRQAAGLK